MTAQNNKLALQNVEEMKEYAPDTKVYFLRNVSLRASFPGNICIGIVMAVAERPKAWHIIFVNKNASYFTKFPCSEYRA